MSQCKATSKRTGQRCKLPAADGYAVCRFHGGATPRGADSPHFRHGRYSRYLNQSLQHKLAAVDDENPLDLLPELSVQRTLFADYISRFSEGMRLSAADIQFLMGWAAEIGRTVERIVKMRNDTALTAAEVSLIAMRIPEVVVKYLDEPDTQRRFIADLFAAVGVPVPADRQQPEQLGAGGR